MNTGFSLIKNETGTFVNLRSRPTSFALELIRPEYTRPSGYLGVRAGACIRMNKLYVSLVTEQMTFIHFDVEKVHSQGHMSGLYKNMFPHNNWISQYESGFVSKQHVPVCFIMFYHEPGSLLILGSTDKSLTYFRW